MTLLVVMLLMQRFYGCGIVILNVEFSIVMLNVTFLLLPEYQICIKFLLLCWMSNMLNVMFLLLCWMSLCSCTKCHFTECSIFLFIVMQSVVPPKNGTWIWKSISRGSLELIRCFRNCSFKSFETPTSWS